MNQMGSVAFGNLPVLFAISVALAYTKDSGIAAITAVVGFLVFNAIQLALLVPKTHPEDLLIIDKNTGDIIQTIKDGKDVLDHYELL
jgi:PTS system glucose-specific IIC component